MAMTPEYGEEELVHEREEQAEAARHLLPAWEDIGEAEIAEHEEEDERLRHRVADDS